MVQRRLCVSVDLDGLDCYHAIHGLDEPPEAQRHLHYTAGLARLLELFTQHSIHVTLFVVGRDLLGDECLQVIRTARDQGHEIASHTWSHPYDFSRLSARRQEEEIEKGTDGIRKAVGSPPVGFRAPGYHIDDRVVERLQRAGYVYDASLLPSPPYYAAKLAVMGLMRLSGRTSRSIAGGPGMVAAPNRPYRMGARYWLPGDGLVEIPCTVIPVARIPFIGTTLTLAGPRRAAWAARLVSRMGLVSLELHAVDLMGVAEDGLDSLGPVQPDLRVPVAQKRQTFSGVLEVLQEAQYESITLERAARDLFGGR